MKKPKITEGEWSARKDRVLKNGDEYSTIANVSKQRLGNPDWEQLNNATAISAVPQFIQNTIDWVDNMETMLNDGFFDRHNYEKQVVEEMIRDGKEALKKAGVTEL